MLKFTSPYFDMIRVRRRRAGTGVGRQAPPHTRCGHNGCGEPALYPAPRPRGEEGGYLWFCLDHVAAYNKSYDFFAGMGAADIRAFEDAARVGHRPLGANGWRPDLAGEDPFRLWERAPETACRRNGVMTARERALEILQLSPSAGKDEIKARFRQLVKRYHPDRAGKTRSASEQGKRLAAVIEAYRVLK